MSDIEEVDNAEVEYTEGDDEIINHQSVISADRASRMANMVSSGVIDPDSGNKVYFENKPALEVAQIQPEPEGKVEEQTQALAQNEIDQSNKEQERKEVEQKEEEVDVGQKIETLQTQLNQASQANRLGDEILQDSHEMANQGDFKWNSGFNSKISREGSENSHPSQQLQVIPSHKQSDAEQENPTFQKSHNLHQQHHKIEQLKPIHDEVADQLEVVDQGVAITNSLAEQKVEQSLKQVEQIQKEEQRNMQIVDNNAVLARSNILEQEKGNEEVIPAQIQHHQQQRVNHNLHHQHPSQQKEVDAEVEKVAEHHIQRQLIPEAHKQQDKVSPQNLRIKDNNLPSAVLSEEGPIQSQESPVEKENTHQKIHHNPKQNPLNNKQNDQITSTKPLHTYQQVQQQKQQKNTASQIPKNNDRPPSIKRQSMHINSVRQKPAVEQKMKKAPDNCSCQLM